MFEELLAQMVSFQAQFVSLIGNSFWDLIIYTGGITLYAIFVWHFYRFVARRDVFEWDTTKYDSEGTLGKFTDAFLYFFKYLLMYPILVFLWFGVFATFMFVLGKDLPVQNVLLISFALVTAIRVTAYYKEDLSFDIAKLIPLALLAVYVVQPNFFDLSDMSERFLGIWSFIGDIVKFVAFSVGAEWVLRLLWTIKQGIRPRDPVKSRREAGEKADMFSN